MDDKERIIDPATVELPEDMGHDAEFEQTGKGEDK